MGKLLFYDPNHNFAEICNIINVIHPLSYLKKANNLNFQSEKYKLVNSDKYKKPANNMCFQNKKYTL